MEKKKHVKKGVRINPEILEVPPVPLASDTARSSYFSIRNIVIFLIIVAAIILWKMKDYFIIATVNGQPVTRFELNRQLTQRFGPQTLDTIINERLILGATRKQGIFVTAEEMDQQIKKIEAKLEGKMSLSEALAAQGMDTDMLKKQIEIQLSIEKLFAKEATISSTEVEDYIKKNAAAYKTATDPAKLKEEVNDILKQQKVNEQFDTWFGEVRKNASVQKSI